MVKKIGIRDGHTKIRTRGTSIKTAKSDAGQ